MSAPSSRWRFYSVESDAALGYVRPLPRGFVGSFWRPTVGETAPPSVTGGVFAAWWMMHHLHLFANVDYGQYLVREGERIVHRSGVFPRYARFPFMGKDDLQIGDTWTHPDRRGKGLASAAIVGIVRLLGRPGRRFWYIVADDNAASVRAIESVGFALVGVGERQSRFGVAALGAYVLTQPGTPATSPEY